MKWGILLFLLLTFSVLAEENTGESCDTHLPAIPQGADLFQVSHELMNFFEKKYYLYYESKNLEDLQLLKNCVDYISCGKGKESIVIQEGKHRVHLWKSMTETQLRTVLSY